MKKITFHNGSTWDIDDTIFIYPFPNYVKISLKKITITIGVLPMAYNAGWEDWIMYRYHKSFPNYTQYRFLIFAIAWGENVKRSEHES